MLEAARYINRKKGDGDCGAKAVEVMSNVGEAPEQQQGFTSSSAAVNPLQSFHPSNVEMRQDFHA